MKSEWKDAASILGEVERELGIRPTYKVCRGCGAVGAWETFPADSRRCGPCLIERRNELARRRNKTEKRRQYMRAYENGVSRQRYLQGEGVRSGRAGRVRLWRQANKGHLKEYFRRPDVRDKQKKRDLYRRRDGIARVDTWYVKNLFRQSGVCLNNVPTDLIEAKREHVLLTRSINQAKKELDRVGKNHVRVSAAVAG